MKTRIRIPGPTRAAASAALAALASLSGCATTDLMSSGQQSVYAPYGGVWTSSSVGYDPYYPQGYYDAYGRYHYGYAPGYYGPYPAGYPYPVYYLPSHHDDDDDDGDDHDSDDGEHDDGGNAAAPPPKPTPGQLLRTQIDSLNAQTPAVPPGPSTRVYVPIPRGRNGVEPMPTQRPAHPSRVQPMAVPVQRIQPGMLPVPRPQTPSIGPSVGRPGAVSAPLPSAGRTPAMVAPPVRQPASRPAPPARAGERGNGPASRSAAPGRGAPAAIRVPGGTRSD